MTVSTSFFFTLSSDTSDEAESRDDESLGAGGDSGHFGVVEQVENFVVAYHVCCHSCKNFRVVNIVLSSEALIKGKSSD